MIWYVESTSFMLTHMECIANSTLPLVYCKQQIATSVQQTANCHQCISNSKLPLVYCKQQIATSVLQTAHCHQCIANSTLPLVYCKQHIATSVLQIAHCHQCIANSKLPLVYCKQHIVTSVQQTANCHQCIANSTLRTPTVHFVHLSAVLPCISTVGHCRPHLYRARPQPSFFLMQFNFTYFVANVLSGG